jgi:F0F1-type ATP synthase epsilon subunit
MLTLEIITPDEQVLSTEAVQVILPTSSGETGILTGTRPHGDASRGRGGADHSE